MSNIDTYRDMNDGSFPEGLCWYCPNGHEVFRPRLQYDEPPECGTCGSEMSTDSDSYYDVIELIEVRGIAKNENEGTQPPAVQHSPVTLTDRT